MMKQAKTKIILSIFLTLVLLSTSLYFVLDDKVRVDIKLTYSDFSVYEDGSWVLAGREYVNLFDGTAKMRAKNRSLDTDIGEDNITKVTRIANYKDGISTIEVYTFDPSSSDVELFPINHSVNVINGKGKLLQYEVQKLLYTGETIKDISSPQSFGHNMKVEWEDGNYYSKIYKYLWRDEGKLTVKYRVDSDDYFKNVRLFDPPENITVILNSPTDNYCSADSNVTFNCLAEVAGGYLSNIGLWTNESGSWGRMDTEENITISTGDATDFGDTIYSDPTDPTNRENAFNDDWDDTTGGYLDNYLGKNFTIQINISKVEIKWYTYGSSDFHFDVYNGSWYNIYNKTTSDVLFRENITVGGYYSAVRVRFTGAFGGRIQEMKIWEDGTSAKNQIFNRVINASTLWSCQACDLDGDCNFASENRTVYLDEQNPLVEIIYPENITYTTDINQLNYSASDENPDKCWYSNDSGVTNYSVVSFGTNFTSTISIEGSNIWIVYCNDTAGYENSSSVTFFKDALYPQIVYSADSDTSNSSGDFAIKDWVFINVTTVENNVENYTFWVWTSTNSSFNKTTFNTTDNSYLMNLTGLSKDIYFWNVTVCDILGQCNTTDERYYGDEVVNFSIDGFFTNQEVELGGDLNISATSTFDWVFIDVNHPSYGDNYSSGKWSTTFELLIDWFRKTLFPDSSSSKEFNFTAGFGVDENMTFNLSAHQYDEIVNVSFNISGTNNPLDVAFYKVNSTEYDRMYYGNLTSDGYIQQNKLVVPINNTNVLNESQVISFDNNGSIYTYFYLDSSAKLVNFLLNVTSITYGFDFTDSFSNDDYIDSILTTTVRFMGLILPAVTNVMEFVFDDFGDGSINQTIWYDTPDESTGGNDEYYETLTNSETGGYLRMYSRLEEDMDTLGESDSASVSNNVYTNNESIFNIWTNEDTFLSISYNFFAEERYSSEDCDIDFNVYFGNAKIWELDYQECSRGASIYCDSTYSSSGLNFTIDKDYNTGAYVLTISGVATIVFDTGPACGTGTYTWDYTNNLLSYDYSDSDCTDSSTYLSSTYTVSPTSTSPGLKFYTDLDAHIEYVETGAEYECIGDGMAYDGEQFLFCYHAESQEVCEQSWPYGSCTWTFVDMTGERVGCMDVYSEIKIYNVNRSLGVPQNSTIVSHSVFDSAVNINSITSTLYGDSSSAIINALVSGDNGDNWQEFSSGVSTPITYPGKHQKWMGRMKFNDPGYMTQLPYFSSISMETEPSNVSNLTFDFGDDGIIDYTIDGELGPGNGSVTINLTDADITNAFTTDPIAGHTHSVKLVVSSDSAGSILINDIDLVYNPNPIFLTISYIQDFLSDFGDLMTNFIVMLGGRGNNSQVTIDDLKFDYAGGNKTYTITAHNNDSSVSVNRDITLYYSYWDYSWVPENVEWLFFNPLSPTAKNIVPYGQTDSIPILNITNYGYGVYDYLEDSIAHYVFNNANHTTLNDTIGSNDGTFSGYTFNDGAVTGATLNTTGGKYGSAYEFDGVDDEIEINDDANLDILSNRMSYGGWVNLDKLGSNIGVMDKRNAGQGQYNLIILTSSQFACRIWNATSNINQVNTFSVPINTWTHLFCVYNGTDIIGYANGNKISSSIHTGNIPDGTANNQIGVAYANNPFNGSIDEVRIWNKALTQTEIQAEMNSSNPVKGDGLVSSWSFEQNNATHTMDTNNLVEGIIEEGVRFEGVNDRIAIPTTGFSTSAGTISSWFKIPLGHVPPSNEFIFGHYNSGNRLYIINDAGDSSMRFQIGSGAGFFSTSGGYFDGEWHHIVMSWNGTLMTGYIDGVYQDDVVYSGLTTIGATAYIGDNPPSGGAEWNGSIDDVRIYDVALTEDEIEYIYNSSNGYEGDSRIDYKNTTLSVYINDTLECVDMFMSSTNTKPLSSLWDGLVSYFSFDLNAEDNWGDNDGTVNGATHEINGGQVGGAYEFDGTDDYVSYGNITDSDEWTIALWFKNNIEWDGTQNLLIQWYTNVSGNNYIKTVDWQGNHSMTAKLYGSSSGNIYWNGSYQDEWGHISLTYGDNNFTIYGNGVPIESRVINNSKWIHDFNISRTTWDGSIDEVRIYNRSLSDNEISELYNRSYNKYHDVKLKDEWQIIDTNRQFLDSTDIYLWADYDCSFNNWRLFSPSLSFRQCSEGSICSEEVI